MKGLHLLTIGDFVYVFLHLQGDKVGRLLAVRPRLEPWRPDIAEMYEALRALPSNIDGADANPDDAAAGSLLEDASQASADLNDLDRTVEASVRVCRWGLRAGYDQALGKRDTKDAARWRAADIFLFPDGLKFLQYSLPEQVGETVRLLERAKAKEVEWLSNRWSLHGQTFAEALAQVQANNAALNAALLNAEPKAQAAVSVAALRRRAQRLLSDLLPLIDRAFPADAPERATILDPLQARVTFRVQKQAAQKAEKAQKERAVSAAPVASATAPEGGEE
jgi:hypothetical protein